LNGKSDRTLSVDVSLIARGGGEVERGAVTYTSENKPSMGGGMEGKI